MKHVESARDMLQRGEAALPADIAIFAAAVADWRVANARRAETEEDSAGMPPLQLVENPDILATISGLRDTAPAAGDRLCRRDRKPDRQCQDKTRAQGLRLDRRQRRLACNRRDGRRPQHVHLLTREARKSTSISWPVMSKEEVAAALVTRIAESLEKIRELRFKIDVRQLPHGDGLALPAYQSAHAAGLDLLAAVPEDAPLILSPGQRALVPTGLSSRCLRVTRRRSVPARGWHRSTASPCSMHPAQLTPTIAARSAFF